MYVELIKFRIKVCKKYYLHLEEQLSKYITERFKYDTLIYNNCIWFHDRDVVCVSILSMTKTFWGADEEAALYPSLTLGTLLSSDL